MVMRRLAKAFRSVLHDHGLGACGRAWTGGQVDIAPNRRIVVRCRAGPGRCGTARASDRLCFPDDSDLELRRDLGMNTDGDARLSERLDRLVHRDAPPLELHAVLAQEIRDVL